MFSCVQIAPCDLSSETDDLCQIPQMRVVELRPPRQLRWFGFAQVCSLVERKGCWPSTWMVSPVPSRMPSTLES